MARGKRHRNVDRMAEYAPEVIISRAVSDQEHIARGMRNAPKYGITSAEYQAMFLAQDRKCAICRRRYEALVIDHDHETGEVRGLLCAGCNSGLGFFKDSPQRLANAIVYLRRPPASWD